MDLPTASPYLHETPLSYRFDAVRAVRYGELLPVGDPQSLADAMQRTLQMPKSSLPPEALQPFETNHVIQQYIELIQEMTSA